MKGWSGRDDLPEERWHQMVQPWSGQAGPGICVVGFPCDIGVSRNFGRVGAAQGPAALRCALGNLPTLEMPLADMGDVFVGSDDLEGAQLAYAAAAGKVIAAGWLPIGLGGGHEIAFGSYLACAAALPADCRIGIVNLDAHLDMRPGPATSGTSFRMALEHGGDRLRLLALGISEASNTRSLFSAAREMGASWVLDTETARAPAALNDLLESVDALYMSVDLDVLPASVAPGVSAPAAYGIPLTLVETLVRRAAESGKLAMLDVAELNPSYDEDGRTARTAARLVYAAARSWKPWKH